MIKKYNRLLSILLRVSDVEHQSSIQIFSSFRYMFTEHCQALPLYYYNVSNVTLGFNHVQLYSLMMDVRHPKHVGGLTAVCYIF
jgi:hypothetical protein